MRKIYFHPAGYHLLFKALIYSYAAHFPLNRIQGQYGLALPVIRFLISNCACLGHLERSAAESRDLVTVHGLVSYTRFLRLKATPWPSGRNDISAQFNRIWY